MPTTSPLRRRPRARRAAATILLVGSLLGPIATLAPTSAAAATDQPSAPLALSVRLEARAAYLRWETPDELVGLTGLRLEVDREPACDLDPATHEVRLAGLRAGAHEVRLTALSPVSAPVTATLRFVTAAVRPGLPRDVAVLTDAAGVHLTWLPPLDDGDADLLGYQIGLQGSVLRMVEGSATSVTLTDLPPGPLRLSVAAVNPAGAGGRINVDAVAPAPPVAEPVLPGAPRLDAVVPGAGGGALTVRARWTVPGGVVEQGQVRWQRVGRAGVVTTDVVGIARTVETPVAEGLWVAQVRSRNAAGWGPWSARSAAVRAR